MSEDSAKATLSHYEKNCTLTASVKFTKSENVKDDPLACLFTLPTAMPAQQLINFGSKTSLNSENRQLEPAHFQREPNEQPLAAEDPHQLDLVNFTGNSTPPATKKFQNAGVQCDSVELASLAIIKEEPSPSISSNKTNDNETETETETEMDSETKHLNPVECDGNNSKEANAETNQNVNEENPQETSCLVDCLACCIQVFDCTIL